MTINNYKLCRLLDDIFPTKTFVITTKSKTKFIKITSLMQLFILTFTLSFGMFCSIQYRIYTNNKNIAFLLEENELLKRENQQYALYYKTISNKINTINNYLGNKNGYKTIEIKDKKDISNIKNALEGQISMVYSSLNKRSKDITKKVSALGIDRLTYSQKQKIVSVDVDGNKLFEATQNENNTGGEYEPVKQIKTKILPPVIQTPSTNINEKNIQEEMNKMIKAEKFLQSLPIGSPMKGSYKITSKFGIRKDPFVKSASVHRGLDIVIANKNIYAPTDGIVVFAGRNTGYGNMISIDHNMNKKEIGNISILTRYCHLDKIMVKNGEFVKKGQLIAKEGTTGRSTAPHLHYEVVINNQHFNPINFINNSKQNV